MKKIFTFKAVHYLMMAIFISLIMSSCGPSYRVATSFYLLQRGMTKQEFVNWAGLYEGKNYIGKWPVSSKSFKHGNDVWEVWVFEVYRFYGELTIVDHHEHVAFKNGRVEEWGTGDLPITIRQNPNQFQYDININR
jgi:hypothetical protein